MNVGCCHLNHSTAQHRPYQTATTATNPHQHQPINDKSSRLQLEFFFRNKRYVTIEDGTQIPKEDKGPTATATAIGEDYGRGESVWERVMQNRGD